MKISQKIIDYAIWYYLRYYPSENKLRQKLKFKFGPDSEKGKKYGGINKEEINYIITEKLRNIIQEEEVARSKIRNYISKNKNLNYIKQKLREKLFGQDMIDDILSKEFLKAGESLLSEHFVQKQINKYKLKGKSRFYISGKLIERKEDRSIVQKLLEEIFKDGEIKQIKKEYDKISQKYDNKKIIERLLRKGFNYNDIKTVCEK